MNIGGAHRRHPKIMRNSKKGGQKINFLNFQIPQKYSTTPRAHTIELQHPNTK